MLNKNNYFDLLKSIEKIDKKDSLKGKVYGFSIKEQNKKSPKKDSDKYNK